MGPKKQARKREASTANETSKRSKKASNNEQGPKPVSIKDHVVGRRSNKLTDFFVSSSQNKQESTTNPATTVRRKRGRPPKAKTAAVVATKKTVSRDRSETPPNTFQQLQQEMDSMSRQSVYLHDLPEPISSGKSRFGQQHSTVSRIQASPPTYTNFTSEPEDDSEFVEQVSHHTIELQDNNNVKTDTSGNRRRSSYLNRGRRMLSIGNGFDMNPHDEIPPTDYYKMLGPTLTSAEKMKKLLVWCIRASMDQKEKQTSLSSEEKTVFNIARVVTEEILKGLIDDDISVDWGSQISKKASIGVNGAFIVPNPHNVDNKANIEKYRAKLAEVKREKAELMRSYNYALKQVENDARLIEPSKVSLDEQNRIPAAALNGSLVDKLEDARTEGYNAAASFQNESVSQLATATYQMKNATGLVGILEESVYAPKVSQLLKNYINKNSVDKYKMLEKSHKNIWPVPERLVTTNELLVAMARQFTKNDV